MAISKVVLHDDSGADRTLVDLTGDTVAPETLMKGTTAHDKAGNPITGTAKQGGGVGQKTSEGGEIFNSAISAGENSHAEGLRTVAYGKQSHAEGFAPPDAITGTLNVTTSEIVGTGKDKHTQITVSVPKSDCDIKHFLDEDQLVYVDTIVGIKFASGMFNKYSVFTDNTNILNTFDFIPQTAIDIDPQSILIKVAEAVIIPTGSYDITLIQQGAFGTSSHAEGGKTIAAGQASHAEGFGSKVLYKTERGDPIGAHAEGTNTIAMGKGSHSEGGDTHAEGKYSHAEGEETTASGSDSHAEGNHTEASGRSSHTEGLSTLASGENSHAEGEFSSATGYSSHAESASTASGDGSHSEGSSEASGTFSHSEGVAEAKGYASHAEGSSTASGIVSHSEGNSTAASDFQHTEGRFNLIDASGRYLHIVGNGEPGEEPTRSNAHTLDTKGNAWYQGSVLVGGKDMDAPDAELNPDSVVIKSSAPGSTKRFKITVDDTGTIKATEVV